MKILQYIAIALGLVLYGVENTYVSGQHVCTYNGVEIIPRHGGKQAIHRIVVKLKCCDGYEGLASIGDCKPSCPHGCGTQEHCSAPNQCKCNEGYQKMEISGICKPICSINCEPHSFCSRPEYCDCYEGYQRDNNGTCQPVCENCGLNQICREPNQCECLEAYHLGEQSNNCYPVCESECAPNSSCIKPGECHCNKGYCRSEEDKCEPVCIIPCGEHGICHSPDQCLCSEGYTATKSSGCEPICSQGCANGSCIAPENCVCPEAYERGPHGCQLPVNTGAPSSSLSWLMIVTCIAAICVLGIPGQHDLYKVHFLF